MTIGQLAQKCKISTATIRFYEQKGLMSAARMQNNYRIYTDEDALRMELIMNAKKLGFSLMEITGFLDDLFAHNLTDAEIQAITGQKIKEIDDKIEDLKSTRTDLISLIDRCHLNIFKG